MFAKFPFKSNKEFQSALLAFSSVENEIDFSAHQSFEFRNFELRAVFEESLDNMDALIVYNCVTNLVTARIRNNRFIGRVIQRNQLSVKDMLDDYCELFKNIKDLVH